MPSAALCAYGRPPVSKLLADLEPKAGGCSDGRSRSHDLPPESTFHDYFSHAKDTLIGLGNEGHLITQLVEKLAKEHIFVYP